MSNLMDELKKAGLTNAKKQKQVEREKKQQQHQALKQAPKTPAQSQNQAAESPKEEGLLQLQKQQEARLDAIYKSIEYADWGGRKRFYIQTPTNKIVPLLISDLAGILLERGKLAIIQAQTEKETFCIVKRSIALALDEVDSSKILYFQRKEK